jgi:hypothetical protein
MRADWIFTLPNRFLEAAHPLLQCYANETILKKLGRQAQRFVSHAATQ